MLKEMIMPNLLWKKIATSMIVNSLPLAVNIITIEKELKLLFPSQNYFIFLLMQSLCMKIYEKPP